MIIAMEDVNIKTKIVIWLKENSNKLLAEFISTMLLLYFGCMCCIPEAGQSSPSSLLRAGIGFGLVVMFNIVAFGHISGAHMNPIVTLASVLFGDTTVVLGIFYFVVQCLGSATGSCLLEITTSRLSFPNGSCIFCVTQPAQELSEVNAVCIEILLSSMLIFICCSVWDPLNRDNNETVSLKFGLTVVGLSLGVGPLTGASMNPARSLGPAIVSNSWRLHWVYWVGPCIGAIIAVFIYKSVWLSSKKAKTDST